MKKRTFYAIAASVILSTTIISCGSDSAESNEAAAAEIVAGLEEAIEEVAEEVVEEVATSINGEEFFASSGCVACHQVDTKTVGPSLTTISASYVDNKDGLLAFMNGDGEAIVDPAMEAVMAPQVEITKAMTVDERDALADYILSK